MIDGNLRLPVAERMRRHFERVRMYQRMQERTLTERERAALRKAHVGRGKDKILEQELRAVKERRDSVREDE